MIIHSLWYVPTIHALLIFAAMVICTPLQAQASKSAASPDRVVQLLNSIRSDPYVHLPEMGIDLSGIIADRPELASFLDVQMPALEVEPCLQVTAEALLREKANAELATGYEGLGGVQEDEYDHCQVVCPGHTWVLLEFDNYINLEHAEKILIKQMLVDELNDKSIHEFVLLNPYVREVGIFMDQGLSTGPRGNANGYSLSVVSAVDREFMIEGSLEVLINEFRQNPEATAGRIGVDINALSARLGEDEELLQNRARPLARDVVLSETAIAVAEYLDQTDTGEHTQSEVRAVLSPFLDSQGFDPNRVFILIDSVELDTDLSATKTAETILRDWVDERQSSVDNIRKLTIPLVTEMAFRIYPQRSGQEKASAVVVGLLVRPKKTRPHVLGVVQNFAHTGSDEDGQKDFAYARAQIRGMNAQYVSAIDPLGRFQFRLPGFDLPFVLMDLTVLDRLSRTTFEERVFLSNSNVQLDIVTY